MRGRRLLIRISLLFIALAAVAFSLSGRPDRVARAVSCVVADGYETNNSTAESCLIPSASSLTGLQISTDFAVSGFDNWFGFIDIVDNCHTPANDEDWYSVDLQAGFAFAATVANTGESNQDREAWVDLYNYIIDFGSQGGYYGLEIYDPSSALVHSNYTVTQFTKTYSFTVPTTGIYKVRVFPLTTNTEAHCEYQEVTGGNQYGWGGDYYQWSYSLTTQYDPPNAPVVTADIYEQNDFAVAPYTITPNFTANNPTIFPAGDDDWFRFLGSTGSYSITVGSAYGVDLLVELYGPSSSSTPIATATGTNPILTGNLTESGYHLIRIDSVTATEQTLYTFSLTNTGSGIVEDSYEQNDTIGTARLVTPANNLAATMYPANDPDFYLFAGTAGTISASVTAQDSDQYTIRLYDPSNTQVATAGPSVNPSISSFTATTAGNYKLEVVPSSATETGAYTFSISNTASAGQTEDTYEQNDSAGTARLVTPASNLAATLYPANDPDYYLFAANPGTVTLSLATTDGDQYTINLLSPANVVLASSGPSQNPSISNYSVTTAGNYKLEVLPATTTQTGPYTFSISATATTGQNEDPYEQNDNASTTYGLTLPITLTNTTIFPASDPDFFRFFSNAGTATINIYPNDTDMRFTVNLVNPDGTLNSNQTNVANPAISATLTQSGNYRLEIMEITGRTGGYTLSASYSQNTGPVAADPYEENDSYATPKQIGANDNITTTTIFPASDPDYFQFFGTAGKLGLYLFAQNSNLNFTLRLYDPNGNILQTSTGPNASIVRDLTFQGYYTIEILETTGTTGKYLLNIGNGPYPTPTPMGTPATPLPTQTPSPTPDMGGNPDIAENNNSWGMAFRIAPGNEITALNFNGGWGVDDIDYFAMNVKKDVQYTCETYNLGLGTDTIMSIYGPTADTTNLIGTHDDIDSKNGDVRSKLTWKSAYQGQVYIVVDQVGPLTYPGAATYDFACDTGTSAGGSSTSGSTTGGGGGGGASGGTTGGASGSNAISVEIIGAPERVAPPEPPPAGSLSINVLIAYDENANGLIDLQEGVLGMSVRAIDVSTNKQLSSGFTDSQGNLQLLITAPQGNDVMIVVPFLSVGKTFTVNEFSTESWRVLLPSSLLPGLIP